MSNKKKIVILLIILLIILIKICIDLYLNMQKRKPADIDEVYHQMMKVMVMPNGIFQLKTNYKGSEDLQEFYISIKDFSKIIVELSNKNEEQQDKYYEENKTKIKKVSGINSTEKFEKLKGKINETGNLKDIINADIDTNSFKESKRGLKFKIKFIFPENKYMNFNVELLNRKGYDSFAKYSVED